MPQPHEPLHEDTAFAAVQKAESGVIKAIKSLETLQQSDVGLKNPKPIEEAIKGLKECTAVFSRVMNDIIAAKDGNKLKM